MDDGNVLMSIQDPAHGNYQLAIKSEAGSQCSITIGFTSESTQNNQTRMLMAPPGTTMFSISLRPTEEYPLILEETPQTPETVAATAVNSAGLKTLIQWEAPEDDSIAEYRIYARNEQSPVMKQIGTSHLLSFETGELWAVTNDIPVRIYAVSSVNSEGRESFLSSFVRNDDRDNDGLSDTEETKLGTNPDIPDTDEDGLNDGDETYHGTNPLLADTDRDGYSDYEEVQADSDPLDDQSIPDTATPTVETAPISEVTYSSAVSGGTILSDGGAPVTENGVCWGTSDNPTIADNITTDSVDTASYVSHITGLEPLKPYYVRAYASNNIGTGYGESIHFTTLNAADLAVEKFAEPSTVRIGDEIVYSISVLNIGPGRAENIQITDQLPEGLTHLTDDGEGAYEKQSGVWSIPCLEMTESRTLHITAKANRTGAINNSAERTSSIPIDPDPSNDFDQITVHSSGKPMPWMLLLLEDEGR